MVRKTQLFYRRCWLVCAQRYDDVTLTPYLCTGSSSPQETTAICALWSGNLHLEVEDICRVPMFEKTLKLKTTTYSHPGISELNN
jgi:hypothetical protein